ncbi:MAG: pyridoxamine 5'-phosphate oxidase family protein [Bacilli bacterium]|nr:pyridoxamine 5'-phosphate oxidase family protein [Bacilli bacterium]
MKRVNDFLKEAGVYYLATMDGAQPRVRPFGTVNIYEGKLYIQSGKGKEVAKQIKLNPKVEICAFKDDKWIRICGTLVEDETIAAKKAMLDAYPNLRSMYDENDDKTIVYYFKDAYATISSFMEAPIIINF